MSKIINLVVFFLLQKMVSFSQNDTVPKVQIHYVQDRTVYLIGVKKSFINSDTILQRADHRLVDKLVDQYDFQYNYIPDTTFFDSIQQHIYLDRLAFSDLLKKSKIKMYVMKYGYGGATNFDDLSDKYGVTFISGGCVIHDTDEFERQIFNYMRKLLDLRNGNDWEQKYNEEARERK